MRSYETWPRMFWFQPSRQNETFWHTQTKVFHLTSVLEAASNQTAVLTHDNYSLGIFLSLYGPVVWARLHLLIYFGNPGRYRLIFTDLKQNYFWKVDDFGKLDIVSQKMWILWKLHFPPIGSVLIENARQVMMCTHRIRLIFSLCFGSVLSFTALQCLESETQSITWVCMLPSSGHPLGYKLEWGHKYVKCVFWLFCKSSVPWINLEKKSSFHTLGL